MAKTKFLRRDKLWPHYADRSRMSSDFFFPQARRGRRCEFVANDRRRMEILTERRDCVRLKWPSAACEDLRPRSELSLLPVTPPMRRPVFQSVMEIASDPVIEELRFTSCASSLDTEKNSPPGGNPGACSRPSPDRRTKCYPRAQHLASRYAGFPNFSKPAAFAAVSSGSRSPGERPIPTKPARTNRATPAPNASVSAESRHPASRKWF